MGVGPVEWRLAGDLETTPQKLQNTLPEGLKKQEGNLIQNNTERSGENPKVKSEELQKMLEEIKRKFDMFNKYLKIDIDTELNIPVAKIIEKDTNRVIRQIPPDYLLELMKKIDQMLGILLEKEV